MMEGMKNWQDNLIDHTNYDNKVCYMVQEKYISGDEEA